MHISLEALIEAARAEYAGADTQGASEADALAVARTIARAVHPGPWGQDVVILTEELMHKITA